MMRHWMIALLCLVSSIPAFARRCEVWEDAQRINHARTEDEESFAYCFGYLHGRDRAWMMDHFRRVAMGTNAEVHGFSHLKGDMIMRLLDLPGWAEKLWAKLGEEERSMLSAYSAGVNHGFRVAKQQPTSEFHSGHPMPDKWKPIHSLMVLMLQSFDQTRKGFFTEWEEAKSAEIWKEKTLSLYDADGIPWDTTVLKDGEYTKRTTARVFKKNVNAVAQMWSMFPTPFGEESGSNNWVVSPEKTLNKKAMLANDPHLDLKTPMFWYWIHMEGPNHDVIGASLPGVPLIVSGANRHVSWGLTNSYVNTADAFHLDEKDASELESFRPLVWVKWGFLKIPIFFKSFERTKDGFPVIPLETADKRPLLLKWSGFHMTGDDLSSLRMIMKARSAEEMESFLSRVGVPSWNFVFADTRGKIGHRVVGKAFKGTAKDEAGLRTGTLEEVRQPNFLSADEMPHVFNPKRGYIVTANNRHWPADSALYGGRAYSAGFRAMRIEELLLAEKKHDVASFRRVQCDDQAVDARFLAPLMSEALLNGKLDEKQKAWVSELQGWDFKAGLDCRVCPIYRRTLDIVYEKLRIYEVGFYRLGQEKNSEWQKQTQEAFQTAFKELNGKVWREVHLNSFAHMSNRSDWVYSPEIPTRGDKQSVDPGTSKWNADRGVFEHTAGASERLIVVMNDIPELWLTLPGLNTRYDNKEGRNPWQAWADCQQERVEWPIKWEGKNLEKVEVEL